MSGDPGQGSTVDAQAVCREFEFPQQVGTEQGRIVGAQRDRNPGIKKNRERMFFDPVHRSSLQIAGKANIECHFLTSKTVEEPRTLCSRNAMGDSIGLEGIENSINLFVPSHLAGVHRRLEARVTGTVVDPRKLGRWNTGLIAANAKTDHQSQVPMR